MTSSNWVILDRDGVINFDSDFYIKSVEEWQAIPGSIEAIARLKKNRYRVAVVTNQSGLSRGLFNLDNLEAMHAKMSNLVEAQGATLDAVFYCPHTPDEDCLCRKPRVGMLDVLEEEFDTTVEGAYLVGDQTGDLLLALEKKCQPILVLTGKGEKNRTRIEEDPLLEQPPVFKDLAEFVDKLLSGKPI